MCKVVKIILIRRRYINKDGIFAEYGKNLKVAPKIERAAYHQSYRQWLFASYLWL